jgi:BA14K-like protein
MHVIGSRALTLKLTALTLAATLGAFVSWPVSALPLSPAAGGAALTAQLDQATPVVQVRSRRRGGDVAAGIVGGMILGGIIASQRPYYYDYPPYYYRPYRSYYYPAYRPYYRSYPYDPAIAYCMRRFRSYDPYSMTYLGYDGFRHPCP